jgi:predicted secreted Zn-dependent protease
VNEPIWRTAGRCDNGACVEVGILSELVMVRSSKDRDGTCVSLSRDEWQVFVAGVKDGDFDGL